jgi:hypothetical protein
VADDELARRPEGERPPDRLYGRVRVGGARDGGS